MEAIEEAAILSNDIWLKLISMRSMVIFHWISSKFVGIFSIQGKITKFCDKKKPSIKKSGKSSMVWTKGKRSPWHENRAFYNLNVSMYVCMYVSKQKNPHWTFNSLWSNELPDKSKEVINSTFTRWNSSPVATTMLNTIEYLNKHLLVKYAKMWAMNVKFFLSLQPLKPIKFWKCNFGSMRSRLYYMFYTYRKIELICEQVRESLVHFEMLI